MRLLDKIEIVMEENNKLCDTLYSVKKGENTEVNWDISESINLMNMFINIIPALVNMGFDISADIPVRQMDNLKIGLEKADSMKVADCLKYEINDTILTLKELVLGGVIKNEELL